MNIKVIIISVITAVLFAVSGIIAYILMKPSQNKNVEIVSNGNVLYSPLIYQKRTINQLQ